MLGRRLAVVRHGVPKEAICRLLGHHSWEFTAGTYVLLDDDDLPDGVVVGDLTAIGMRAPRALGGNGHGLRPADRQTEISVSV
jgi:hypothetical protein